MPLDNNALVNLIPYGLVLLVVYFLKRTHAKIESDIDKKADKSSLSKEVERLNLELTKANETHERDMQRMERISSEKIDTLRDSISDRLTTMEHGINGQLKMLMDMVRRQ